MHELGTKLANYRRRNLAKVKRMGLEIIDKCIMQQYFFYLVGLQKSQIIRRNQQANDAAINYLLTSLRCSKRQSNQISRKALLQLHRIYSYMQKSSKSEILSMSRRIDF